MDEDDKSIERLLEVLRTRHQEVTDVHSSETDLKNILDSLRHKDELYRLIAELSSDAIVVMGNDGLLFFNQTYLDLLGYSGPEDLAHQPLMFNIHPEDRSMVADNARRRLEGESIPPRYEFRMLRKDGSVIDVEISAAIITYRNKRATLIFLRDITERKQTEAKLKDREEQYRLVVENAGEAINVAQNGYLVFVNRATIEILMYPEEVLMSRPFTDFIHPEDRDTVYERHYKRLNGEIYPHIYPFRIITQDGVIKWVEIHAVVITWRGQAATLNFLSDITERRKLESQLQQAQKMEAIGTLAGGIAHDFNNLLMGIQGYVSLMLLHIETTHPHYEKLKSIEAQVQSGANLTRQLLGFARGGRYEVRPTNLNELIVKTVALFARTKKEIHIHETYEESLLPAEMDRGQIEQVILNLLVNAWQAMPGGGSIYIKTENIFMDKNKCRPFDIIPGPYVKVCVTDTGMGMDEKTQERVFDPFFTTKEMGRGTGLGLASAYGIINGHGGIINVYSEKGHGTTFSFYLPALDVKVEEHENQRTGLIAGEETILLVDDEPTILEVTKALLESLGYLVLTARSGLDAINVYENRSQEIDLVILDMIMPDMGGGETFDRMKAINPAVKVILSSGYSMADQAKSIMALGIRAFIQKPFQLAELSQRIRTVLDGAS
ncbi:MAG: Sensor histidine kinase RcsC [Syntrophus sp. SKADARSKE-3]|nr:Sensor histidine kinase RcsC [Syntrophus sp. SKADARSKE-3]